MDRRGLANLVVIGEHLKLHGCEPCQFSSNACLMFAMAVFTLHRNWFKKARRPSGAALGAVP
jgi:hypothetical protein